MSAFHSFSTAAAREVGVNAAVLLHHIAFWCESNRANGRNLKDGRYWTYNSYAAFEKLFPYLTYKQIRTALGVLEKEGLIVSASYNEQKYDRTKWYRPTDRGLLLEHMDPEQEETPEDDGTDCPTGQDPLPSRADPICPTGQTPSAPQGRPIPDSNYIQVVTNKRNSNSSAPQGTGCDLIESVVTYLNDVCGTRYKTTTPKTRSLINARSKEGFTLDDFRRVIDVKATQWLGDPKMRSYLRPETLFGPKFESYLNEPTAPGRQKYDWSAYDF